MRPTNTGPLTLSEIAALLAVPLPGGDGSVGELTLTGVTHDSADVRPGDLFAALPGAKHHGIEFLDAARERGAVAVLTDARGRSAALKSGMPALVVLDPRASLGRVAAAVYGRPAEAMLVLGVTGTNGKTTTAHMIYDALAHVGRRPGLIGTIETRVGDDVFTSVRTTPEATDLQATLAVMRERGADSVVMEASSIAVSMGRVDGLVYDVVGFTNLSQDHLDFHGDMDAYFAAKAALFTPARARSGVVVVDDEAGRELAARARIPITTVSVASGDAGSRDGADSDADWRAVDITRAADGSSSFTILAPGGASLATTLAMPARFNVANALLAVAMLAEAGTDVRAAVAGVASCTGVPGRMELVSVGQPFTAVVDYAHTPGAVAELVRDLRESTSGRVLLVLGCGGDRDVDKRPLMGEAGARGADVVVVTDDNPRSEDPATIRAAVLTGARSVAEADRAELLEIADRARAIQAVVDLADAGDVVVIAGKGHEQGQEIAGQVLPFDDRAVLRAALAERWPA